MKIRDAIFEIIRKIRFLNRLFQICVVQHESEVFKISVRLNEIIFENLLNKELLTFNYFQKNVFQKKSFTPNRRRLDTVYGTFRTAANVIVWFRFATVHSTCVLRKIKEKKNNYKRNFYGLARNRFTNAITFITRSSVQSNNVTLYLARWNVRNETTPGIDVKTSTRESRQTTLV